MNLQQPAQPVLHVDPDQLDFGIYQPGAALTQQPERVLRIRNTGGGLLRGRILTQVSWLILPNIEIECQAGQQVEYHIRISTGAPQSYKRQDYDFKQVLLLDTNGGSAAIGGGYRIGKRPQKKISKIGLFSILIILPVLAGLVFFFPGLGNSTAGQYQERGSQLQSDLLYTSGAETVLARAAETDQHVSFGMQAPATEAQPPLLTKTPTISISIPSTFTPWPFETFPSPETLVKNYYQALNSGSYEEAWAMLSPSFQQACCALSGNDPFVIYRDWWSVNVESIEVQSAYLQAWDENPASVLVAMSFYYTDGKIEDLILYHMIIVSPEGNRLLINEVR